MVAPKLVYAKAIGQTSVKVVFDRPMREVEGSDADPATASLWTSGNGLPDIADVLRHSLVEFELLLSEPADLGAGYSITVAGTVENTLGEKINPNFVTLTFDVISPDLAVTSVNWTSPTKFAIDFSLPLNDLSFESYGEVLVVQPTNGGRLVAVRGLEQDGSRLAVTLDVAGTAGAAYSVELVRSMFSSGTTALRSGEENLSLLGQGSPASVVSATSTTEETRVTLSEALNFGLIDPTPGLPLFAGAYAVSKGSLGSAVRAGVTPAEVRFPEARFVAGDEVQWSLARAERVVSVQEPFLDQASSAVGSGSETPGSGSTALVKQPGVPFEVVFSGGVDSMRRAGRRLSTQMAFTFTPSAQEYPLAVFTFLNTQVSVLIKKTEDNAATAAIYCGARKVGEDSAPFEPTVAFDFTILDATSDNGGFFAVMHNGNVIAGASATEALDSVLIDQNAGATSLALMLGSPSHQSEVFSLNFLQDVRVESFLTTGLRGQTSRDLVSFDDSLSSFVVDATASALRSPGFQNTGRAAFGVHAEYIEDADAVQVVVALNERASIPQFTGAISLLTGSGSIIDQVQIDESFVLVGETEIVAVFLHPASWLGLQVGVSLQIGASTLTAMAPVAVAGRAPITAQLTEQPASWGQAPVTGSSHGPLAVLSS